MNTFAPLLTWLRRRLRSEERGFTLVELMVAQGIILVSLLSLAYTATVGFTDIALARQRQGATGYANRLVEQIRALPFDVLKRGLSNSDATIATDPAIVSSGCGTTSTKCYRPIPSAPYEGVPRGDNAVVEPLNPHRATQTIGSTSYTRYVYVTYYNNDPTLNAYRIVAVVSWTPPQRFGVRASVMAQTVAYSPSGCTSTATHPFAAPCQPFVYGSAQIPQGSIVMTGTPNTSADGVRGITDFDRAVVFLPNLAVSGQTEQITAVSGRGTTSGIELKRDNLAGTLFGQNVLTSAADNDPTQPSGSSDFPTYTPTSGTNTAILADDDQIGVVHIAGNALTSGSTMTANGAAACGTQIDNLPCARASTTPLTGPNRIWIQIDQGGVDLENAFLATVSSSSSSNTGVVHRELPAALDGSMGAQVTRNLSTISLGSLPQDMTGPAGWDNGIGLMRISGYTASLEAQAGESVAAMPLSAAVTGGTLQYWNGTGYTTVDLRTSVIGTAAHVFTVTLDRTQTIDGKPVHVVATGTFRAGGVSTSSAGTSTLRTAADARALSPLIGTFTYQLDIGPTTESEHDQAALTIAADLGTAVASATYAPAPGAGS